MWYLYILMCGDHSLYTGITTNVLKRFSTHQSGKGSKYVRSRLPITLMTSYYVGNRSEASKEEYRVKQLTKLDKIKLINQKNSEL